MTAMLRSFRKFLKRRRALRRLRHQRRMIEAWLLRWPSELVKPVGQVMNELRCSILQRELPSYHGLVGDYFDMGLHFSGAEPADYVYPAEWWNQLRRLHVPQNPDMQMAENKEASSRWLRQHGLPTPASLGVLREELGKLVMVPQEPGAAPRALADVLEEYKTLFCKPADGEQGKGCLKLEACAETDRCLVNNCCVAADALTALIAAGGELLVEAYVLQHETLVALHPGSVNTLRLWTMRRADGQPEYLQGIIRMGTGGATVDNASQGGIFAGIRPDGRLMEFGHSFRRDAAPQMRHHPDTGVEFASVTLPFFTEATRLVCRAHAAISPQIFALAWDVAITPEGPLIIEINPRGGIGTMQRAHGGWRRLFLERLVPAVAARTSHT